MHLQGEHILLRPWRKEDISSLVKFGDNPNIARNLRNAFPSPYTETDAQQWIDLTKSFADNCPALAIEFQGEAIGGIGGEFKDDVHHRTFEIGYWLGEPFWGQGIISEALALLCDHLFTQTHSLRIEAHVYAWNPASARVLVKNGFQLEGTLRNAVEKDGEITDVLMHAKLRP